MIKRKKYLLAFFFFAYASPFNAQAQTYHLQSLDDNRVAINLNYKLYSKELTISCLSDTLRLIDYTGTIKGHILNNKFLQIGYEAGGGTGSEIRNTVILSVVKNKIYVSMLVNSYASWFSPNPDNPSSIDKENRYALKFNITGDDKSNYKLTIALHDQQTSKLQPQTNYDKNELVKLAFDPIQNIFYSTRKNTIQSFTINDPKTQRSVEQRVNGPVTMIVLGNNSYYYIKGEWYRSSDGDSLFKEYYK